MGRPRGGSRGTFTNNGFFRTFFLFFDKGVLCSSLPPLAALPLAAVAGRASERARRVPRPMVCRRPLAATFARFAMPMNLRRARCPILSFAACRFAELGCEDPLLAQLPDEGMPVKQALGMLWPTVRRRPLTVTFARFAMPPTLRRVRCPILNFAACRFAKLDCEDLLLARLPDGGILRPAFELSSQQWTLRGAPKPVACSWFSLCP